MGAKSGIEWTDATWNPLTGCNKVSPGCKNCYAERLSVRLKAMGQPNYSNGFKLTLHENSLEIPLHWKRPMNIFVNSMSDLFHEDVPVDFIQKVFDVMEKAHWHRFQILTKRAKRLLDISSQVKWASNIWMGVSVENQDYAYRIDYLRETDAFLKFLSVEPMLGPLNNIDLNGIDWVIVGGESGQGARPINPLWVTCLRDKCQYLNVPFFFKQWGGVNRKKAGRKLDGRAWNEMPHKRAGSKLNSINQYSQI